MEVEIISEQSLNDFESDIIIPIKINNNDKKFPIIIDSNLNSNKVINQLD